jgi:hypothetical protein
LVASWFSRLLGERSFRLSGESLHGNKDKEGKRIEREFSERKGTKRCPKQIKTKVAYGGVVIQNCNINSGGV